MSTRKPDRLARAHHAHLSARGVAQSGGAAALGLFGVDDIIRRLFSQRMFPITVEGLEGAMREWCGSCALPRRASKARR